MVEALIKSLQDAAKELEKDITPKDRERMRELLKEDEKLVRYIAYTTMLETFKLIIEGKKG